MSFVEKHGDVSACLLDCLGAQLDKGPRAEFGIHRGGKRGRTSSVMAFYCGAAGKLLFGGLVIVRLGMIPSGEGFGEEIWGR